MKYAQEPRHTLKGCDQGHHAYILINFVEFSLMRSMIVYSVFCYKT